VKFRYKEKGKMMDDIDYVPGYDDGEWIETDDEWLDDFQGEEDWA
jgi:hypothetical protein